MTRSFSTVRARPCSAARRDRGSGSGRSRQSPANRVSTPIVSNCGSFRPDVGHLLTHRISGQRALIPRGGGDYISMVSLILRSEEHTSELQSLMRISYAVFCLKKKKIHPNNAQLK